MLRKPAVSLALLILQVAAVSSRADDALQWSGFALLRAASDTSSQPLDVDRLSSQLQVGIDWLPSPAFSAHVHLLARTDEGDERTRRGHVGIPEAYAQLSLTPGDDRLRLRAGAFFLPTSRENVDALWETPYTITASALNSWFGEELRPIGIDASYFRGRAFAGATLFRGNDTFGALPSTRGWRLDDHWALLGEWIPVDALDFTSVSAENDGRLGWSARGGWNGQNLTIQLTHLDNRSDGLDYGELFNWGTYFDIAAVEFTKGDWTIAAESGWGPTFLVVAGQTYVTDLKAGYALVSRMLGRSRATVRFDSYRGGPAEDEALTLAYFFTPVSRLRTGIEWTMAGGDHRVLLEARYRFSGR